MPIRRRRAAILLIAGIFSAVGAGIGFGVTSHPCHKSPELIARVRIEKLAASAAMWTKRYGAAPPSDVNRMRWVNGVGARIPLRINGVNPGVEALYQALFLPGFDDKPDVSDTERANGDEDRLDKPLALAEDPALYEFVDPWSNPLVYFTATDYAGAERDPPAYSTRDGEHVHPRPWRTADGFANPDTFQLFSMGPDCLPNTADDVKAWDE